MDTQQLKLILTADASGVTGATTTATRSVEKLEGSVGALGNSLGGLARTGVAAFLGSTLVSTALAGSRALYEASAAGERLRTMLDYATGGKSAAEMVYISGVANRLGLDMQTTAQAFGSFAAAAKGTSLEGDKARSVFEAVAKSSAVMGNTADETRGILLALQQMLSKGTVSAEELRGQLGERMPGAFQIAARSMGVTTQELGKMLEQGQVLSEDFLPKFARQLEDELGGAADKAAERLDAATNRMGNAWERLKRTIGDSGVAEGMAQATGWLTNDLNAISDAMEMARVSGSGFWGQMNDGAGMLIGRALGLQAFSAEFLPLADRIKVADERLAELRKKADAGWGVNIYFKADLASAKAEVEALQALQIAMGQKVAGAGRGDGSAELAARNAQAAVLDPYAGAQSLDAVRRTAKLRQDIQREEGAKAVEIAKAYGKAIAQAGEGGPEALRLATERDERLKALRRDTHSQLEAYDKAHSDKISAGAQKQETAFAALVRKIQGDTAKAYADAQAQVQGLSSAQEAFLALAASADWAKLTNAQRAQAAALFENRIAQEANNAATAAGVALKRELATIEARAAQAVLDETASVAEHVKRLEDETARIGATTEQLAALEAARIAEALATAEATLASKIAAGARAEELEGVTLLVEELRKLQGAQAANAGKQAAVNTANEWKKAANDMEQSITDALFRAFESGKGFAQSFRDVLVNAFKTKVIKPLISNLLSSFTGGGGGGFNLGGLASLFGGSGSADFLAGMRGASLSGGLAGPTTAGAGGMMGAGAGVGGAMSSVSSFAPYAAAIYAGMQLSGGAFDQGFNARNLPWTKAWLSTGGIAPVSLKFDTMTLEKLGVNSRLANQITGASLWSKAFGRADRQTQETGLQGMLGAGALSGGKAYTSWLEKGGWFRSDKSGTDLSAMTEAQAAALGQSAKQVLTDVTGYLDALALPADKLAGITYDFKVALGDNAEENAAALEKVFGGYQDKLADSVAGVLQPLRKAGETATDTLKRLAGLQTFSVGLNDLGGIFSRIANTSVAAREELIGLAGGMDQLMQQAMGFAQNYYNAPEIAGIKASEIQRVLAEAGITQDLSSKEQFRALVESIDPATAAGREQLAALLKVQGDFAQVAEYMATAGGSLGSTAAQAPASGPLASLFAQQGSGAEQQVAATNAVATGVDLVRQAIETLTAVVQAGAAMVPATSGAGMREPYRWEVQP